MLPKPRRTIPVALTWATAALVAFSPVRLLAQPVAIPPDIVRRKDGGMLRGTIIELVPETTVQIQLANGETRIIPMSEVEYAGPAKIEAKKEDEPSEDQDPSPTSPSREKVRELRLELRSAQPGVTFHWKAGTSTGVSAGSVGGKVSAFATVADHFRRLCTAPCTARLPAGTYRLALSEDDGVPVAAPAIDLHGDARLQGTYVSNRNTRGVGWLLMVAGLGVGGALVFHSSDCTRAAEGSCEERPYFGTGLAIAATGSVLGLLLGLVSDRAEVDPL